MTSHSIAIATCLHVATVSQTLAVARFLRAGQGLDRGDRSGRFPLALADKTGVEGSCPGDDGKSGDETGGSGSVGERAGATVFLGLPRPRFAGLGGISMSAASTAAAATQGLGLRRFRW